MRKLSTFGISHIIVPIALVVIMGTAGTFVYAASHAATPDTTSSNSKTIQTATYRICLSINHSECIATHGPGHTVTVQTSSYSTFELSGAGTESGQQLWFFADTSGNYLEGDGSYAIIVRGVSGGSGEWIRGKTGTIKNVGTGTYLGTQSTKSGSVVRLMSPKKGYYWGWQFIQAGVVV
jgi:hypothetical protein